jgi:NADH dehydrogenase
VEKNGHKRFNKVIHTENIFAIGDTCIQLTDGVSNGHPQHNCIQQGINLAENFKRICQQIIKTFKYNDKGSMAYWKKK